MPRASRKMVTALKVPVETVEIPEQHEPVYRFVCPTSGGYTIYLNDEMDDVDYVKSQNGGITSLVFQHYRSGATGQDSSIFQTKDERIAQFMRRLKDEYPSVQYDEDLAGLPIRCTWCDWTLPDSTDSSRKAHYDHLIKEHASQMFGWQVEDESSDVVPEVVHPETILVEV